MLTSFCLNKLFKSAKLCVVNLDAGAHGSSYNAALNVLTLCCGG